MNVRVSRSIAAAVALLAGAGATHAQGFGERMAREAMAEPFVGLTTDGTPEPGLFAIERTGIDVAPLKAAAVALLATLSPDEQEAITFPIDSEDWRHWANFHAFPRRNGLSLEDMGEGEREAVFALLRAALSAAGYQTSRDIMRLNHHLGELVGNFREYGEFKYWLTLFGDPAGDAPFGFQFEGHHLIINAILVGDQLVMTPTFMGSEPVRAETGDHAGTVVLQDVQDEGLAFMRSLSEAEQAAARIGPKEGRAEALGELFKDNIVVPYEGIRAGELDPDKRAALLALAGLYIANMPQDHAALRMEEIAAHLDDTHFAWKGGTADDSVFYYRLHSPVVFIEFDHQGLIALPGPAGPSRRHIHTVVRTPNGNDYGRNLLAEHLATHAHGPDGDHLTNGTN
ncbi:DUF3500 domain-containing protein [Acuticoccus kandeliae]|uniref:DUF3500 domain-containing protein n=1 Tax=Acuticoccus kandeliae TaxID=2073160 RepID=UPI000D3E63CB|nr:DUF3500 domain-containing protein [Acuticoccus kandeliae]